MALRGSLPQINLGVQGRSLDWFEVLGYRVDEDQKSDGLRKASVVRTVPREAPVLPLPNFTEQFSLFTDASGVGIGAVLNENHRPIAFASRTLNKAERNYTDTEREYLAVIWALNKFKTFSDNYR
ncbi:hypothetical protein TNCV_2755171 [Trichonephila clavipes]|nr:hypothetical protein TNCV_2755171 [Trichonephila clavipes]